MKIAIIGDIHSRKIWKDVVLDALTNKVDKIIFLGDYIDPYFITTYNHNKKILNNIINFKKHNINDVILIIGNHDAHYIYDSISPCQRYDIKNANKLKKLYKDNFDLFQIAYQEKNHLFTHAGVSDRWLLYNDIPDLKDDKSNIGEVLNNMTLDIKSLSILNKLSYFRGGFDLYGGPLWANYNETQQDYIDDIHQYVGHNKVEEIHTSYIKNTNGSITYCDVLHTPNDDMIFNYLIIEI